MGIGNFPVNAFMVSQRLIFLPVLACTQTAGFPSACRPDLTRKPAAARLCKPLAEMRTPRVKALAKKYQKVRHNPHTWMGLHS
jgi:hypothetical protein